MFKVGDIVEAFGVKGKVIETDEERLYGVAVEFLIQKELKTYGFTRDGLSEAWHKEPSLKLIDRPQRTKKVNIFDPSAKISVNSYNQRDPIHIYFSDQLSTYLNGHYSNVKVTLEFEVEEE